ncbi:MAG: DUF4118 domain-containing protein [Candidatus Eremiobacteraeota bacterium]|nr:DUF4118 domain-containing protein [Candidatus Eremiobacteraeota bacterium]
MESPQREPVSGMKEDIPDSMRTRQIDGPSPDDALSVKHHAVSLLLVGLVTVLSWRFSKELKPLNIAFLYLIPVVLSASWWGRWPSYVAALTSVILFDVLFIPPIFHFTVYDTRYVGSFFMFLVIAFIIGGKTEELRREAQMARLREKSSRTLYEFARNIAGILELEVIARVLCTQVAETLERDVVALFPLRKKELEVLYRHNPLLREDNKETGEPGASMGGSRNIDSAAMAVAGWAYRNAKVAGRYTETLAECQYLFLPLISKGKAEGVLGIHIGERKLFPEQWRLLETWVQLAAVLIERVKLKEAVQEAALIAESERLHTALFNSLSHELKTPLSTIIAAVSALMDPGEYYSPGQKKDLLDEINGGARRLERVVENLLDTARLESGMLELKPESCDLEDVVGTAIGQMKDLLRDTPVEVRIPRDLPFVRADSVLIELVLVNLIDNALKFSPGGSAIIISARGKNGSVEVSVADMGKGIPEADLVKIFDKFYRVTDCEKKVCGSGLGLSICKAVIESHGGEIQAANGEGGGAVMSFTLPRAEKCPEIKLEDGVENG